MLTEDFQTGDKFRKIFTHPDKDEIISRLISGESTRVVEYWLRNKYPASRLRQISYLTLQRFRKDYLDIEGEALKQLKRERELTRYQHRAEVKLETIQYSEPYKAGLQKYIQESLIDHNSEVKFLLDKCYAGIERLEDLDEKKGSHLNHAAIAGYLDKLKGIMEFHSKMLAEQEKKATNQVEHDYEVLNKKVKILMEVIKDIFQETAPELQPIFVSRVKEKMDQEGLYE